MDRTQEFVNLVWNRGGTVNALHEPSKGRTGHSASFLTAMDSLREKVKTVACAVEGPSGIIRSTWKTRREVEREQKRMRGDIQSCQKLLDQLQWEAKERGAQHKPMERAHAQGMLLIESERLSEATKKFDQMYSRTLLRGQKKRARVDAKEQSVASEWNACQGEEEEQLHNTFDSISQQQLLASSSNFTATSVRLDELEMARDAHRAVVQISSLNHLFSTEVVRQTHQIEAMYEDALAATQNFQVANVHLQKTIERSSGSQCYVFLFFVAASLALLFLDWLSG